jgi:hypothetical protein
VAALAPLACCLSAYTKLRGDLGPADPEVNCTVDESIEFRLGCIPRRTRAPKPLQDLSPGSRGRALLRNRRIHRF